MSDPTQYNILWGRLEDERRAHRAYQRKLKARIEQLEARVEMLANGSDHLDGLLQKADELADAVSAWETESPAKLSTYFRAMSDALTAYREASNGTKARDKS